MPTKHQLSLEIPHTNNVRIFRIQDTSIYADTLPVRCGILEIVSPGFTQQVIIETQPGFNLVLNACTLGIVSSGCDTNSPVLPDGVYRIRYSVSPNDKVYVEYYHLRVSQIINMIHQQYCNLEVATCCEPDEELKRKFNELRYIRSVVDSAVVKTEDCHEPQQAVSMLTYARRRLEKISGKCKNC